MGPPPKEKRFPKGTALRAMKSWQEDQRAAMRREDLRPGPRDARCGYPEVSPTDKGALPDILRNRKHENRGVATKFGQRRRDTTGNSEIEDQVRAWQRNGVAASTIRHRLSALSKLYKELDGRSARNPVATGGASGRTEARGERGRDGAGAQGLRRPRDESRAEQSRVENARTGARNCGDRDAALASDGLARQDIWLEHDPPVVFVNQAGKGGKPHWKPLTESGVEEFKLFIEKGALGEFSQSSIQSPWKLACEDADVPFFNPYKLRHTWATTLRAEGMDLADVQELVGHTSAKTTARYAMVAPQKLVGALDALNRAWSRARDNIEKARNEASRGTNRVAGATRPMRNRSVIRVIGSPSQSVTFRRDPSISAWHPAWQTCSRGRARGEP